MVQLKPWNRFLTDWPTHNLRVWANFSYVAIPERKHFITSFQILSFSNFSLSFILKYMFTVCAALQVKHTTCKLLQWQVSNLAYLCWGHDTIYFVVVVGNTILAFCGWIFCCVFLIFLEFQNRQKKFVRISQFFSGSWFLNVYSVLDSGKLGRNVLHSWLFVKTAMKTGKFHQNIHIVQCNEYNANQSEF